MKTLQKILLIATLLYFGCSPKTPRALYEKEKQAALDEATSKTMREAKKEARRIRKQGYANMGGDGPIEKQVEDTWAARYTLDDTGEKKFYVTTQEAKSRTFAAAKEQAKQLCLADFANQIGSNIVGRIKSNIANAEDLKDAATVTEVVSAYQNTVSAKLGRTDITMLLKKVDKATGLTYVMMSMKYNKDAATNIVRESLTRELKEKAEMQQEEINKIMDF
ncbi:hypothetical protein [Sediminitomix flava]|uniref:LPP20 lipoprotein n=1 Tax=Sediminitomix flava TaxID=379075 RepID=A0A315Z747_SEDFL|nr:hypothetical protein [Sediminitomix flava]PWJ40153.1 hypothetical protein BC781_105221 [Sediminitomix flava]